MDQAGRDDWACAVSRRARQRAAYDAAPEAANYARTRHALRARIRTKRRQIEELENRETEDIRRA